MDLKLTVKNNFFKNYPNFTVDKTKISIASFLGVMLCIIIADMLVWYNTLPYAICDALSYAPLFAVLTYLVALVIEHDMFNTNDAKKLLDKLLIMSIAVFAVTLIASFLSYNAYYIFDYSYGEYYFDLADMMYPLFYAIVAFLITFIFGQILAISIENGIKPNAEFPQKITTVVFVTFLIIFAFKAVQSFAFNGFYFYWLWDAVDPLLTSIGLTIPVLLMGYSLAVYVESNETPAVPGMVRVPFGDNFSMELPQYNASLPNYGFEVQKPVSESFGELKQWFGGNVSIKYFSFKDKQTKNSIMEDMKNIPGMEKIPNSKYIIQKDNAENIYNVFYFKDTAALNLFGNDLNLLLTLMDSVEFGAIKKEAAPAAAPKPAAPSVTKPAASAASSVSKPAAPSGKGIMPLKEKGLSLPASPVCDVCNKPLDVDKSWFVPNNVFYGSQKYRKWNRDHFPFTESDAEFNMRMKMMENNDPTEGSAVCEDCIDLFR